MMSKQHTQTRDYSGLFLGVILAGLVAIVLVLMIAVAQSRARLTGLIPRQERVVATGRPVSVNPPGIIYFARNGTN